ncbi:hypothetical protein F8388_014362 [Cannabis sativa]|uniref:Aldehyde dehydrogenase n=1 Tax=Cannabis sativa TaxID=3483 RepID=A0A7J6EJN6_CANSA|nr:hypothetical protein F8388_014362 [Cannabis sativa]
MAESVEMTVFEGKDALNMAEELRVSFGSGKTRSYEWRISQLKAIINIISSHEPQILKALHSDLSKPEIEAYIQEREIHKKYTV